MKYELFYLIGASKETELEKIKQEVAVILTESGGSLEEKEVLEKRKMSYEIKHETHGIYVTRRFELESEKVDEVIKKLNLNNGVLRFVLSRAEDLPELKTKEERIKEASQKQAPKPRMEKTENKTESTPRKDENAKTEKGEKTKDNEKKEISEDIDKKLEEILNI